MLDSVNDFIIDLADQPWVYVLLTLLCIVDAFFPPLPSESIVVALASLSATGVTNVWLIVVLASVGAFIGDNIAYQLGHVVGLERFRWQRTARVRRAMSWASEQLAQRGGVLIITARYVPVGRIAVNMTAGATRYPRRQFIAFDAVAALSWAGWSTVIGRVAGGWTEDNPLLGAVIAIAVAIVIGVAVDHLMRHFGIGGGKTRDTDGKARDDTGPAEPAAACGDD